MFKQILAFSLLLSPLFSDCCLDDCQIQATLFFLKPSIDQNSYVISSTNNRFGGEVFPNGKRHLIHQDYKPGFRIESLSPLCNCPENRLNLRFTYFNSHDSSSTSGPFLFDTVGYPGHGAQSPEDTTYQGFAKMRHHPLYYAVDATINHPFYIGCCDQLTFLFGLHYSHIKFKLHSTSEGTFLSDGVKVLHTNLHQESKFWGIGPEIGVDYLYTLPLDSCCGTFSFNTTVRGILLATCNHAEIHYITNRTGPVGVNLKNKDSILRVNPALNAQIGLSHSYSFLNFDTFIEIGYEWIWYQKSVNKITSYDVAFAGDTWDAFEDLSLQGPFVRLNICF